MQFNQSSRETVDIFHLTSVIYLTKTDPKWTKNAISKGKSEDFSLISCLKKWNELKYDSRNKD